VALANVAQHTLPYPGPRQGSHGPTRISAPPAVDSQAHHYPSSIRWLGQRWPTVGNVGKWLALVVTRWANVGPIVANLHKQIGHVGPTLGLSIAANVLAVHHWANVGVYLCGQRVGSTLLCQRWAFQLQPTCWQYIIGPTLGFICAANRLAVLSWASVGI
jgi:hypothetical protein